MGSPSKIFQKVSAENRAALDQLLKNRSWTYREAQAWLRERGCRVGLDTIQRYAKLLRLRRVRMHRFLRVDRLVPDEYRAAYDALISDPRTTTDHILAWLNERNVRVSRSAIERHRNRFLNELEDLRHEARHAEMVVKVAKENGIAGLAEAALVKLEQFLLEFYNRTRRKKKIEPEQLTKLTRAMVDVMGTRETAEAMRREFAAEKRKVAEEANQLARRGVSGKDIAARVKEILGA